MAGRQLSLGEWCDAAFTLLVESIKGPSEPLHKAIERANDMFLAPEELRRKQNAEAFRKLRIPGSPGGGRSGKVTPLGS